MAYSKENAARASEIIAARRSRAISEWESHVAEIRDREPDIDRIDSRIRQAGPRIYRAVKDGEKTETVEDIKKETVELTEKLRVLLRERGYPENYLDVNYTCERCSDTGYRGLEMCTCLKEELSRAALESSGLSRLVGSQTFDSFDLGYYEGSNRERMRHNAASLRSFAENFDERQGENWLLLGPTGLGKTHLSTAVAAKVIASGHDVVYDSVTDIMEAYEEKRFGRERGSDAGRRYAECELLIIDDLGTEMITQFTVSCLYSLINARIVGRRSTVINTNFTQSDLREKYDDRITSRLFGEYRVLLFDGTDVRMQNLKK